MKWATRYSPIGLDIGSHQVKMAQLKKPEDRWVVHEVVVAPLWHEEEVHATENTERMVQCITTTLATSAMEGKKTVTTLPCSVVDIRLIHVSLPSEGRDIQQAIRQEAASYLPYDIEEAIFDYTVIEEQGVEETTQQRLLLVTTPRESVDNYLSLLQEAGLQCLALDVLPLALSRLILQHQHVPTPSPLLVVDIGCHHSTAFVLWRNALMYSRTFHWGGALLTQAIMKELRLNHQKAERLKQQHGIDPQATCLPTFAETSQRINMHAVPGIVSEIVRPQLEYLAQEIERILSYWGTQFRGATIDRILLSGGSAALKNLDGYLQHRMGIDVAAVDPLDKMHGDNHQERSRTSRSQPAMATAVGLALRGVPKHGRHQPVAR